MSLILIPGLPGSGKSHMLFQRVLREAKEHPLTRYIVLVPEQNTLQTQKTLVSMSERGGIWNIDVLSFTRLAYRVFEQTGVERRQVLSETGKVLLLRLIASREGDRIPLLSGILDRPGSLSEIKSILSEMDQYGIGADSLRDMGLLVEKAGSHPALSRKLSEIALLQEAFERYQADHFTTGEKLLRVLSEKAPLDESLKGCVICLDSFTGLTPAQLQVITTLLRIAKDILVTVTIDPAELPSDLDPAHIHASDHELFALPKRTIQALLRCAAGAGVLAEILPVPEGAGRRYTDGGELEHLEKHFLRPGKEGAVPYRPQGEGDGAEASQNLSGRHEIFLRQCTDPWDEAVSCAVTIEELIRDGVRLREIAVVCGSLKDYAEYVRRAMSVYEIPCYIDRSSSVVMNPAFEFVRCAIDVLEKNFSYESIMALCRTALMLDPDSDMIDLLENYILAAGIRGHRMWSKPFTRPTREKDQALLDQAESARAAFMERFEPFWAVMIKEKALFSEYAGALWHLLLACNVPEKLDSFSRRCREEGREARAQEYAQVLRVIADVLDEAALLMGEETLTRMQFSEILRAGFSEAKIGILPRGIDQVQVGDLERSRLEQIRVVLFLGLNDGFVPRRKKTGGVLTDLEREYLLRANVHLAPTAREEANIQQFYLYLTLSKPSRALYLSWSVAGRGQGALRPSGILRNIRTLFPSAAWADSSALFPFESVTSLRTAAGVLSQAIGDYLYADSMIADAIEPKLAELISLYRRQRRDACLEDLAAEDRQVQLDEETAFELYGRILHGSITRLEEFSECAFRHFADYGLELKEREVFAIRSLDIGNLLHKSMELFSRRLHEEGSALRFRDLTDEERDVLAKEAFHLALEALGGQDLYADTMRSSETLRRCERILLRSVKTMQRQICLGAFEPALFELSFGGGDPDSVWIEGLQGGRKMRLGGKIDRIDECEEEGARKLYVKILDYKSSSHDIDLGSLIEGEQLQLIVYLDAAASLEQKAHPDKEIICAGAFYFTFQDPIVDLKPQMSEEQLEDAVAGSMKLKGLVNGSADVVERLDHSLTDAGASLVVPVIRNKNPGEYRSSDSVITGRQFWLLRSYARDRMRKIASLILSGQIRPNPSKKDARTTACSRCPYRDVCMFDPRRRGMAYREREKRSSQENWALIESAVSGEEESCQNGPMNKNR